MVGSGRTVIGDPSCDGREIAPGDQRMDKAVADRGDVLVGEAHSLEMGSVAAFHSEKEADWLAARRLVSCQARSLPPYDDWLRPGGICLTAAVHRCGTLGR